MAEWMKPLPRATSLSQSYWDGLKAHEVRLQQCGACAHWVFFPRAHCPRCGGRALSWKRISGEGTLLTYTVARVPTLPEFTDELPQLLAVVQLDEGPHLNTTLVGVDAAALKLGERLRPVFDDRPGSTTLLRFTTLASAQPGVIIGDAEAIASATAAATAASAASKASKASAASAAEATHALATQPVRRQIPLTDLAALRGLITSEFSGWSNQVLVTQELINQFAALSGDDYWLHTDPVRARDEGPFGTTIAQGALVQVLISRLQLPLHYEVSGVRNLVNYGSDRIRFAAPVPVGCRIHARCRVKAVEQAKSGVMLTMEINVHVVGQDRPSVVNDLVILYM